MSPGGEPILLARVGIFVECWRQALLSLRRPFPFAILLGLFAIQAALIAALESFPRPPIGSALIPVFRAAGGERALHYPGAFEILPRVYDWLDPGILFLAGTFFSAWVAAALPEAFLGDRLRFAGSLRLGIVRTPAAWGALLPGFVVWGAAPILADTLPDVSRGPVPFREVFGLLLLLVEVGARVLLAYAIPSAVLGGLSSVDAFRRSIVLASHRLWTTLGFLVVSGLPALMLRRWRGDLPLDFTYDDPEIALVWIWRTAIAGLIGTYFLIATTTRLYLHLESEGGEEKPS
jgi:hypothetical protein